MKMQQRLLTPHPYASIKMLYRTHARLKERRYKQGINGRFLRDVEQFVLRGRLTGSILADEADRSYVQALLDYWTNVLYRANWPEPNATLAPFQPLQFAA